MEGLFNSFGGVELVKCLPFVGTAVSALETVEAVVEGNGEKAFWKLGETAIGGAMDALTVVSVGTSTIATTSAKTALKAVGSVVVKNVAGATLVRAIGTAATGKQAKKCVAIRGGGGGRDRPRKNETEDQSSEQDDSDYSDQSNQQELSDSDQSSQQELSDSDQSSQQELSDSDQSSQQELTDSDQSSQQELSDSDQSSQQELSDSDQSSQQELTDSDQSSQQELSDSDQSSQQELTDSDQSSQQELYDSDQSSQPELSDSDQSSEQEVTDSDESSEHELDDEGSPITKVNTDGQGRVKQLSAEIQRSHLRPTGSRSGGEYSKDVKKHVKNQDMKAGDQVGHIIGWALGGPRNYIYNYFPQHQRSNNLFYHELEKKIQKFLKDHPNGRVTFRVDFYYDGSNRRPTAMDYYLGFWTDDTLIQIDDFHWYNDGRNELSKPEYRTAPSWWHFFKRK